MSDLDATTTVEVVLRGRPATIEDVQRALDVMRAEGVPETFEVDLYQREERVHEEGVPYADQIREHILTMSTKRAARPVPSLAQQVDLAEKMRPKDGTR